MTPTFRIWDKQNKRFVENGASLHAFSQWVIDVENGKLYDAIGMIDGDNHDPAHRYLKEAEDYYFSEGKIIHESPHVIQRYTGFKTKDGVKVYEGDIIEFIYRVGDFALEQMSEEERLVETKLNGKTFAGLVTSGVLAPVNLEIRLPLLLDPSEKEPLSSQKVIEYIERGVAITFFPIAYAKDCEKVIGHEFE
jgi:hypothetical protein